MKSEPISIVDAPVVRSTGSPVMPGTAIRESAAAVVGECPRLPFLPLLPERGLGADQVGRTVATLIDVPVDISTRTWQVGGAVGRAGRRATDVLDRDLDALEEAWERARGATEQVAGIETESAVDAGARVQLRVTGPWTLAARVEQPNGRLVLADSGARRDVAESLAEGVAQVASRLAERLGMAAQIVLDEPDLWRIIAGAVPGPSRFDPVAAVAAPRVSTASCRFADALRSRGVAEVLIAVPGSSPEGVPVAWPVIIEPARGETPLDGVVVEVDDLVAARGTARDDDDRNRANVRQAAAALDAVGTALSDGRIVQLGGPNRWAGVPIAAADSAQIERACAGVVALIDQLGAPRWSTLPHLVLAPAEADMMHTHASAIDALAGVRKMAEQLPRIAQ